MHVFLRFVMAVLGLITVYYGIILAIRVLPKGRQSQVALKLNNRKVYDDMRRLLQSFTAFLAGFIVFTVGKYRDAHLIVNLGETLIILFLLGPMTVLRRWTKRVIE